MENLNIEWFQWINAASDHPPMWLQNLAFFCAEILLYVLLAWIVLMWIMRPLPRIRSALLYAALSASLGLAINQLIARFYYHPRPFEMGIGHTLVKHVQESSFPSDHGVLFFSIGLALTGIRETRRWGLLVCAAGVAVAWSRVYIGVHFPLDMIGAFVVALFASAIMYRLVPVIENRLEPAITRLYQWFVKRLHLPFPVRTDVA